MLSTRGVPRLRWQLLNVSDEVAAGKKDTGGSIDLIWINGVNFAAMKKLGLLYGPWATLLPNSANFDFTDEAMTTDKGTNTEGMEFPFNMAQSVFIYDKAKLSTPPQTIPELVTWIKENKGKFIYSDPTHDFNGAAFLRTVFYHYAGEGAGGSWKDFLGDFDEVLYNQRAPAVWKVLKEIEPYLYQVKAGKVYYPTSHNNEIRPLVGNQTLEMDFSFEAGEATAQMAEQSVNGWPDTMQAYVMKSGSISDVNFLAIPVNAAHKEAALVAVNYIGSAAGMFVRSQHSVWGALQCFNPKAPAIKEWDVAFDYLNRHYATPSEEELAAGRLGDLSAAMVDRINSDWKKNVRDKQ